MLRLVTAAVALAAAAAVCSSADSPAAPQPSPPPQPTEKVRKHLGEKAVDLLLRAESAEAVRVGKLDAAKAGADGTVAGREVAGKPVAVGKDALARLAAALLSEDTYFRADSKGTTVGVGYRLRTGRGETVEVSCCLAKGNVWIVVKDADGKVVAQGDRRGFRDDRSSPMRIIAAELFPDDADVQKHKPKSDASGGPGKP